MDNIYLTQAGYDKLFEELEHLKKNKRREISKKIEEARAQGDLSENAEYDAAKEEQGRLEARIAELETKLASSRIISPDSVNLDKVSIGTKVDLEDLDSGNKFSYTILSDEEADFDKSQIGVNSPIAQGLLGKEKGQTVSIDVPRGTIRYKIITISLPS